MKKQVILIILALVLTALIAVAVFAYNSLSESYFDQEETTADTAIETTSAVTEEILTTPSFSVKDKDGNDVKLSDFFGKPIVVNFWATWCYPCTSEMPHFEEAYTAHGDDVQFLMVNVGDSYSEAYAFAESNSYTFPVYHDSSYEASYTYGVSSIPMTLFIDTNGELAHAQIGAMNKLTLETHIANIK